MKVEVVLEALDNGRYRASVSHPFGLSAEAETQEATLAALKEQLDAKLKQVEFLELDVGTPAERAALDNPRWDLQGPSRYGRGFGEHARVSSAGQRGPEPTMSLFILDTDHLTLLRQAHSAVVTRAVLVPRDDRDRFRGTSFRLVHRRSKGARCRKAGSRVCRPA